MTETSISHLSFLEFIFFATVAGSLSLTVLAILVRRRQSGAALVIKRSTVRRAVFFVVTTWLVVAVGCTAYKPTLSLTGAPPKIPHTLEGREGQCLLCHEAGVAGAPRVPANHAGRTSDICHLCHIPAAASGSVAHSPAAGALTNAPAGAAADGQTIYQTNCAACHGANGQGGLGPSVVGFTGDRITKVVRTPAGSMPPFPSNVLSDANLQRLSDYIASLGAGRTEQPANAARDSRAEAPSVLPGSANLPAGGPPKIPHSLEGREGQCLLCHEAGVAGAPRVPVNHAGRTSDMCTACHQPSTAGN